MTIDQAVNMIHGQKGTTVTLNILHSGDQVAKDITITRDTIEVKSVTVDFKDNNIAYVKIAQFSDNTDKEFNDVVNQITAHGSKGIILDLRNNPGGLLDKAVAIASTMIPADKVVVMEEDSTGSRDSIKTTGGDRLSSIPMVVLINEGSASASEILAGALKDDQGITLIGTKSFGKGSVQELMDLPGGSSVKITVAKWLTPNGDYIMDKGITPDISVDMTQDDYNNNRDPQLDKAMEIIQDKIQNH
jgi:carboxyl-terminal processing protease